MRGDMSLACLDCAAICALGLAAMGRYVSVPGTSCLVNRDIEYPTCPTLTAPHALLGSLSLEGYNPCGR